MLVPDWGVNEIQVSTQLWARPCEGSFLSLASALFPQVSPTNWDGGEQQVRGERKRGGKRRKQDWAPLWTGDAKEIPESVLSLGTPFRVSKKSGPQSWGSGEGGSGAQGRAEHWLPLHKHTQVPSCHLQCLPHQNPTHPTSPGSHTHPTGPGQFKDSSTASLGTAFSSRDHTLLCRAPGHLLAQL